MQGDNLSLYLFVDGTADCFGEGQLQALMSEKGDAPSIHQVSHGQSYAPNEGTDMVVVRV